MKLLKSILLSFIFLLFSFTPILAVDCSLPANYPQCCQNNCASNCIDSNMCPNPDYDAVCVYGYCGNTGAGNCICEYNGGGGGSGGGGGGSLSTNIDSQVSSFFAFKTIDNFIPNLLQIALVFGAIIAFLFLIWGGIDYILSGGNQERIKTSKSIISNALAGLAILAAVWVIWRLVAYFLGLSDTLYGPIKFNLPKP